jgi:hypothetical protein
MQWRKPGEHPVSYGTDKLSLNLVLLGVNRISMVRSSAEEITKLLADEFIEFGSSGRVFNKHHVIEALRDERSPARTADGLTVRWLTKYVALVAYRTVSRISTTGEQRRTLRSSIWKRIDGRWQMIFHQGTAMGRSR